MTENERDAARRRDEGKKSAPARLVYSSSELMRGRREVWIEHDGEMYRLRITASGKMYLTK